MKRPVFPGPLKRGLRRLGAAGLAAGTLWAAAVTAGSDSAAAAWSALREASPLAALKWELGDLWADDGLSPAAVMTLGESPLLLSARAAVAELWSTERTEESGQDGTEETVTEPVEETAETESDYFTSARLERRKARDEAIETLAQTLGAQEMTDDEQELATEKALAVSAQIESENKIETLVKAKGFAECLAYVDADSARVIVRTDGLTAETANQIKNIIIEETGLAAENVSVGEIGTDE